MGSWERVADMLREMCSDSAMKCHAALSASLEHDMASCGIYGQHTTPMGSVSLRTLSLIVCQFLRLLRNTAIKWLHYAPRWLDVGGTAVGGDCTFENC